MMTIRNLLRAVALGGFTAVLAACGSGDLDGANIVAAKSASSGMAAGAAQASPASGTGAASAQPGTPPATHRFGASQPIPGRYIVVFKKSVGNPASEAANMMRGRGGELHHVYSKALKGFAATLPDAAIQAIRNNPNVDYVEQDQTVSLNESALVPRGGQDALGGLWGLDRIDQRPLPLSLSYHYDYTGAGVYAFIIDTGIRADHQDFGGRVKLYEKDQGLGVNFIPSGKGRNPTTDPGDTNDCNGHGTHVAGTAGGATYGVAKGVWLVPVRVLDCKGSGTWSNVIKGIDWAADSAYRPAVANLSLGGGFSSAVNQAVYGAEVAGVTMVMAAGNDGANAYNYSPGGAAAGITVGATTDTDERVSWSNYGPAVELFAPGVGILSAGIGSSTASQTMSGTSMATPHVTGVAALALEALPEAEQTPARVGELILQKTSKGRLSSIGDGSPNQLLYSLLTEADDIAPGTRSVTVSDLSGSARKAGKNAWQASVTITITDSGSAATVPWAEVSGKFQLSDGGGVVVTNDAYCFTGSAGTCTVNSGKLIQTTSAKFAVIGVSGPNLDWDNNQPAPVMILAP